MPRTYGRLCPAQVRAERLSAALAKPWPCDRNNDTRALQHPLSVRRLCEENRRTFRATSPCPFVHRLKVWHPDRAFSDPQVEELLKSLLELGVIEERLEVGFSFY